MEPIMQNGMIARRKGVKTVLPGAFSAALVLMPLGLLWSPAAMAQRAATCKPDPVRATHTLPPYPQESLKAKETGTVLLQVTVAANGHVTRADVAHGSGFVRL